MAERLPNVIRVRRIPAFIIDDLSVPHVGMVWHGCCATHGQFVLARDQVTASAGAEKHAQQHRDALATLEAPC